MQIVRSEIDRYMVVLDAGEEIVSSLAQFSESYKLKGGLISGIGAVSEVKLGYYNRGLMKYETKDFGSEEFELISLTGNITVKDGEYFAHVHAVLGRSDFSMIGGHLVSGRISISGEMFVVPLGILPKRKLNEKFRLKLISSDP